MFEILDGLLMFLCCFHGRECTQIFAFARLRVFLTRVNAILAGLQFAYHT